MPNQKDSRCTTGDPAESDEVETVGSCVAAGVTKDDVAAAYSMFIKMEDAHLEEFGSESEWIVAARVTLGAVLEAWDTEVQPDENYEAARAANEERADGER